MKLLQSSESCSRSHNDLACFGKANPRKDASDPQSDDLECCELFHAGGAQ
jgi:hypothetical protein